MRKKEKEGEEEEEKCKKKETGGITQGIAQCVLGAGGGRGSTWFDVRPRGRDGGAAKGGARRCGRWWQDR